MYARMYMHARLYMYARISIHININLYQTRLFELGGRTAIWPSRDFFVSTRSFCAFASAASASLSFLAVSPCQTSAASSQQTTHNNKSRRHHRHAHHFMNLTTCSRWNHLAAKRRMCNSMAQLGSAGLIFASPRDIRRLCLHGPGPP